MSISENLTMQNACAGVQKVRQGQMHKYATKKGCKNYNRHIKHIRKVRFSKTNEFKWIRGRHHWSCYHFAFPSTSATLIMLVMKMMIILNNIKNNLCRNLNCYYSSVKVLFLLYSKITLPETSLSNLKNSVSVTDWWLLLA